MGRGKGLDKAAAAVYTARVDEGFRPTLCHDKETDNEPASHDHLRRLRQACKDNEPHEAKEALLDWAKSNWPDVGVVNIDIIKSYCNADFGQRLDELNKHLYGKTTESWQGPEFLKAFESQSFDKKQKTESAGRLEPLYKT